MNATSGPFVHCELLLGRADKYQAFSSYEFVGGFIPSQNVHTHPQWTILRFPLSSRNENALKSAYSIILQTLDLGLPYNYTDLWQCCIKSMLPYENDLDARTPASWSGGVFCSQAVLLLLRRILQTGGIIHSMHPGIEHAILSTNSRGCSPNCLYSILFLSSFKTL